MMAISPSWWTLTLEVGEAASPATIGCNSQSVSESPMLTARGSTRSHCSASAAPKVAERLLAAASELFYRQGFRAVGVEQIVREARTTKPTLYRYFASKDELSAACLRKQAASEWAILAQVAIGLADDPLAHLRSIIMSVARRISHPDYPGWPMTHAAIEFPQQGHPARQVLDGFKAQMRVMLTDLAEKAALSDPGSLADGLLLLIEGAAVSLHSFGSDGPSNALSEAADALIEAYKARR